jgi:ABC-type antimicrobial peptide transport system permease subunit
MPMAFLPLLEENGNEPASSDEHSNSPNVIELRFAGNPQTIATEVRHVLAEIDPGLPVLRVSTLSEQVSWELNQESVIATLAMLFAFLTLILSCLGVYGLMSYAVQRRTSEIGVRMALGARRATVIRMMVRESLVQGFVGVIIGIPLALAALRLVVNQLYGVSSNDPRYFGGAALVLLLSLMMASYLPARRASRLDPLLVLRHE